MNLFLHVVVLVVVMTTASMATKTEVVPDEALMTSDVAEETTMTETTTNQNIIINMTTDAGSTQSEDASKVAATAVQQNQPASSSPEEEVVPVVLGCARAGLCCQGKNNTCRAEGSRLNSVKPSGAAGEDEKKKFRETCFCDSSCLDLGDCCLDYKQTCAPVDCELATEWESWGECDVRCGTGVKQRVKRVVRPALNGGKPCVGPTVEKAVCEGTSCKVARGSEGFEALSETGKIIPASFGEWRKNKAYNPYEDIRKNLYEHYGNHSAFYGPSYCMQFEITDVHKTCSKLSKDPEAWTSQLTRGTQLCVECQALAMRRKLGGRCKGHGVMQKETRWAAMAAVHGCHGKWVMKSRGEGCQCAADSKFSFILV